MSTNSLFFSPRPVHPRGPGARSLQATNFCWKIGYWLIVLALAFSGARLRAAPGDEHWDSQFFPGNAPNGSVHAIAIVGTNVYVGGEFTSIGTLAVNNIARWDGQQWSALGTGVDGTVYALAADTNGNVFVGGKFVQAGEVVNANSIARWDGAAWTGLGTGLWRENLWHTNGLANALVCDGTNVYVGGQFDTINGSNILGVARWDGESWNSLGMPNWIVLSLCTTPGKVWAGTSGLPQGNGVFLWDGISWEPATSFSDPIVTFDAYGLWVMDSAVYAVGYTTVRGAPYPSGGFFFTPFPSLSFLGSLDLAIRSFTSNGTNLYAGGDFTTAAAVSGLNHIAHWNGSAWQPLGSGTDSAVLALASGTNGDLWVGGNFSTAGGKPSAHFGHWRAVAPLPPTIAISKAVRLDFSQLQIATTYQPQVSNDLEVWTDYGAPFTAVTPTHTQYFDITNSTTFWRLSIVP